MAIGFPASYSKQVKFVCTIANAREAIIYTFQAIGWSFEVLGPGFYMAETHFNALCVSEEFSVSIIGPELVLIESCCSWFQIFDWGKNRSNVKQFQAIFESKAVIGQN